MIMMMMKLPILRCTEKLEGYVGIHATSTESALRKTVITILHAPPFPGG